jgi:hypothetical protein
VSFPVALKTLYADGGIPRFYRGVLPALIQGPMSRFGDTAANTGILTLLDNLDATRDVNVGVKTIAASAAAAIFRIFLMPVDTVKVSNGAIILDGLGIISKVAINNQYGIVILHCTNRIAYPSFIFRLLTLLYE